MITMVFFMMTTTTPIVLVALIMMNMLSLLPMETMMTWKTVRRALVIESKLEVGRPSGKLK